MLRKSEEEDLEIYEKNVARFHNPPYSIVYFMPTAKTLYIKIVLEQFGKLTQEELSEHHDAWGKNMIKQIFEELDAPTT